MSKLQFVITEGDFLGDGIVVGPFDSEEQAHKHYQTNVPKGIKYLSHPKIAHLLSPAHVKLKTKSK